ncbi:QueT transporter family protein [Thermofilum sp.]|jgi:uncharacterized membrane protein|uniref:QueT transporter family protein n=1 Tax=Thermofilum sp. TaxID=1961369 RepID=UPI002584267C|nr:QueT transporter family protein [Thermofilum sp.]
MRSQDVALSALISALYAVLVVVLQPFSFLAFQVRLADALLPLSMVYGFPVAVGVSLGCFVGNFLAAPWGSLSLSMIDAVFGSIANFVASMLAYLIAKRGAGIKLKILGAASEAVVVSIIVGTYLKFLLEWAMGNDLPLILSVLGVLGGSIVSIVIIGVPVAVIVEKNFPRLK